MLEPTQPVIRRPILSTPRTNPFDRPVLGTTPHKIAPQSRIEASARRKSTNDIVAASPYAAGGGGGISCKNTSFGNTTNSRSRTSSNAAWKHKHTKTLPWSEEDTNGGGGSSGGEGGDSGGGGGGAGALDVGMPDEDEGGFGGLGGGLTVGVKAREGYRLQVWYGYRIDPTELRITTMPPPFLLLLVCVVSSLKA